MSERDLVGVSSTQSWGHTGTRLTTTRCRLPLSQQFGWELRLEVNGDLQQCQVWRSQDEVSAGEA